jgi:hypothetical protein
MLHILVHSKFSNTPFKDTPFKQILSADFHTQNQIMIIFGAFQKSIIHLGTSSFEILV